MASGRIIHKDLFLNEDLSELSIEERFLYIGTVVFSDDDGRMKASPVYLKASIFPLDTRVSIEKIKLWRDNLAGKKLIGIYLAGGKEYLYHPNWTRWQSLRKDRYHPSDCPCPDGIIPLGNQLATSGQPPATEPNLTEPNLTEPINEFFSYFLLKTKKAYKLTSDKRDLIGKRLKDGFTVDQLKVAVDNFVADTWEGRKDRLDLIYCIGKQNKKPDNLEKWINCKPIPARRMV